MCEVKETIRLYDADAYATVFQATVLSCEEIKKKKETLYEVILDQTLFFPEEGGQSPDKGTINGIPVLDVQIKKNVIRHTVKTPIAAGEQIEGVVDWSHRFSNMQQHSGEHIFSGIVNRKYGYDNVGFHLSDQVVTMDFNGPLTGEQIEEIETLANEAVYRNVEIVVSFPSKAELAELNYRSKIEIDGQVRIVTVTGYDVCACCAPHVRRTGEIGMIKVMNAQNYKGGVRISILCGFRALAAFRRKAVVVADIMNTLTTGQDQIAGQVEKLKTANQSLTAQLGAAKQELLGQKLAKIPADQKDILLFEQGLDNVIARNAVNGLVEEHEGICGIFMGDEENGYSFILGSRTIDCKAVAQRLREAFGARGGGSDRMIQGSLKAAAAEIQHILTSV